MIASRHRSAFLSLSIHLAVVALLLLIGGTQRHAVPPEPHRDFIPLVSPWRPVHTGSGGHGGGGDRSPIPAPKGRLPRFTRHQLTPPVVVARNLQPKLVIEPTLQVEAQVHMPDLPLPIGDPNGVPGPPSNGRGSGGGIGNGTGGGIGNNRGPSIGNEDGPGAGTSTSRVTLPILVWKIDPDYSDQARTARLQGLVVLRIDVGPDGRPQNLHIDQGLGMGLDEKALEAVSKWKFRPGTRDGRAVAMSALIEVHFRLL